MLECLTCDEEFYDTWSLNDHMNYDGHWPECELCRKSFQSWHACNQHMDATGHRLPKHECQTCEKRFLRCCRSSNIWNSTGLFRAIHGHYSNRYCQDCKTWFQNENNLRQHRNSRLHRGTNNMTCPFCNNGFVSASGLNHHLEIGSCKSAPALNRELLFRAVCKSDPNGIFTNLNVNFGDSNSKWTVGNDAYNHHRQSWLCHLCQQGFATSHGLSQHLNSPKHQPKVYHCPKGSCPKEFAALAGLANHLESESCEFMRYEAVQKQFGAIMNSSRMLTMG